MLDDFMTEIQSDELGARLGLLDPLEQAALADEMGRIDLSYAEDTAAMFGAIF